METPGQKQVRVEIKELTGLQWFLDFSMHQNHPEGLLKDALLDHTTRISDLVSLGWGQECACESGRTQGHRCGMVDKSLISSWPQFPHW